MLDFALPEELEEVRKLAHSIALRPQARAAERSGDISTSLMQTLLQTGLTMPFPESYGGSGSISAVMYALIAEELGFGDAALALNIIGSMMGPLTVALAGNEQQQAAYIPLFCDAAQAVQARGSLAYAERAGGYMLAEIATTARQEGSSYLLNGNKRSVVHGSNASPRVVIFRLPGTSESDGIGACVLTPQAQGLMIVPETQKLGLIAAPSAAYVLRDVVVPEQDVLGEPGSVGVMRAVALYALLRAGVACGLARAALEYASGYAQERIAFGRPIVSYQGIAFMLAEMAMHLDAARLLLWNAAFQWDQQVATNLLMRDAEAAQYQAIKLAKSATTDAVQILGGAGFIQDHPVEMWMRNAAALE